MALPTDTHTHYMPLEGQSQRTESLKQMAEPGADRPQSRDRSKWDVVSF